MNEPTDDQRARLQVMVADMASVLTFQGWQRVHAAVMAGQFGSWDDAPADPSQVP